MNGIIARPWRLLLIMQGMPLIKVITAHQSRVSRRDARWPAWIMRGLAQCCKIDSRVVRLTATTLITTGKNRHPVGGGA